MRCRSPLSNVTQRHNNHGNGNVFEKLYEEVCFCFIKNRKRRLIREERWWSTSREEVRNRNKDHNVRLVRILKQRLGLSMIV
jgi:hypothetical protein